MKTNPDPEPDDALLDAVLRDENWQAANAAFKAEAVGTFRARQRLRRATRWVGAMMGVAAILAGAAHWLNRPPANPSPHSVVKQTEAPRIPKAPRFLTD